MAYLFILINYREYFNSYQEFYLKKKRKQNWLDYMP